MKRLVPLLLFAFMLATVTRGGVAQDATPAAGDSLIAGLGYPVIEYFTDGTKLTGPAELQAGRYIARYVNNGAVPDSDVSFFAPPKGETADQLVGAIAALDPASDGVPEWFFSLGIAGEVTPDTDQVVQLTAGEWVATAFFYGEDKTETVTQKVAVSGEMPEYPAVENAVEVTLADFSIDLPDMIAAGPQIWQVTNTGAMPHFIAVMNPGGEITMEDAVNGVKLEYGLADATPAVEGSAQDPMIWEEIADSATITNGVTTMFEMDLEPGTYIAFCFMEGPGDIGSHALHGMTRVFTVE